MAFLAFALTSCDKEDLQPIECDGECLFLMEKVEGEILFLNCFESYGIKTLKDDEEIYGLPDQMNATFEEVGMKVIFTAKFRENQLEPQLPDPPFNVGSMHQIELIDILKQD